MSSVDLAFTSALEQAQLICNKELSPLELTQLYLERIQRLDGELGSFFTVTAEQALADAKIKTEQLTNQSPTVLPPFFGVPTSIKDLNSVAGVRCTYGSPVLINNIASNDDGVTTRIRQAGFVILGKTATSEVGSLPYTEPTGFPAARNPWNLNYTPGGSSGGAAAAVAAGFSAVAQGSDGGGSIRGPAFCCGLVGIKPARGRVSHAPIGDSLSGIATNGVLARTVTDAAAFLDVLSGYITGDPYWLPEQNPPFAQIAQQATQAVRPLRIAFSTGMVSIGEAETHCRQAVLDTAKYLEQMGHLLEPGCPDCTGLVEPFQVVWRTGVSASGLPPEALQSFNRWLYEQGDSSGDYQKAVWAMQTIARSLVAFFDRVDALLLPTYLHPAIQIGEWANLAPAETLERIIHWIAPCPLANATGLPAIAIPTGFTPEGLPVGVQLVGRPADEATIIALAAQLEAIAPWGHQRPPRFAD
ncbi:MAG: amidase [Elainellaceae cyanobacterium]